MSKLGMGIREWCRANKVAPSTLHKALDTGHVARLADGSVDIRSADVWLALRGNERPRNPRMQRGAPTPGSVAAAQRRLLDWKARLARLEYRKRAGQLIEVSEMEASVFAIARQCRDQLLSMSGRMAPVLAHQDARTCADVIDAEVARTLDDLDTAVANPCARPRQPRRKGRAA